MTLWGGIWGLNRTGVTPLTKLVAICIGDGCDAEANGKIDFDQLCEWCCADADDVLAALQALRASFGVRWKLDGGLVTYQLPDETKPPPLKSVSWINRHPLWLYVISCGAQTKIGISGDVDARLASLQKLSATPMKAEWRVCGPTFAIRRAERTVHAALSDHRLHSEWFDVTVETAIATATEHTRGINDE